MTTLTGADFVETAAFIAETIAHIRKLMSQRRHEAACRSALGLKCLCNTIARAQAVHGFDASILLGQEIAAAESVCAELEA